MNNDALLLNLKSIKKFEKIETHQQQSFVAVHCKCALCTSELILNIIPQENILEIKEEAHCPQCNLRMRSKAYTLQ